MESGDFYQLEARCKQIEWLLVCWDRYDGIIYGSYIYSKNTMDTINRYVDIMGVYLNLMSYSIKIL